MRDENLIEDLRLALDRASAQSDPHGEGWTQIERRLRRETWRRAAVATLAAVVVAATVVMTPLIWHLLTRPGAGRSQPSAVPAGRLAVVSRVHVRAGIADVATGAGAVWVGGLGVTYRVDPGTGHVIAVITTPGTGAYTGIATGAGAVWVTASDRAGLYRIDPSRNRVTAFIRLPYVAQGITVAAGQVWVTQQTPGLSCYVLRVNPDTDHVSGPRIPVGAGPDKIVAGAAALWVTNTSNNSGVSRINPATGTVTASWPGVPDVDAVGAGSLWVAGTVGGSSLPLDGYPAVQRVDPRTGQVIATITVPHASDIVFWHGAAWVLTVPPSTSGYVYDAKPGRSGYIVRIDPAGNRVSARVLVALAPYAIAAGPTGLWVVDYEHSTLIHLALVASR